MSLTIKAYLKTDDEKGEIRRFGLSPDHMSDIHLLTQTISQVFPTLQHGNFSLRWKDPEGDEIMLSCDEELMDATRNATDGILKIYITVTLQPVIKGPVHSGESCHNCSGSIQGARYKCCVCPDYDLCRKCKNLGAHSQHEMWKLTPPQYQWTTKSGDNQKSDGECIDGCYCSANSGTDGAWSSAGSSSAGSGSTKMTWADVGESWAHVGQDWGDAVMKFSFNMSNVMNPFDETNAGNISGHDVQCDGDHDQTEVMTVGPRQNEVTEREKEVEKVTFEDGANKSTTRHTDGTDSRTASSTRVRTDFLGPIHPDPKIAKALIQMLSMGFTNEGRLTKMLEENHGDISVVIESINHVESED